MPMSTAVSADRVLGRALDRKSTRLNSSHSQISYAVFCLTIKTQLPHATQEGPTREGASRAYAEMLGEVVAARQRRVSFSRTLHRVRDPPDRDRHLSTILP